MGLRARRGGSDAVAPRRASLIALADCRHAARPLASLARRARLHRRADPRRHRRRRRGRRRGAGLRHREHRALRRQPPPVLRRPRVQPHPHLRAGRLLRQRRRHLRGPARLLQLLRLQQGPLLRRDRRPLRDQHGLLRGRPLPRRRVRDARELRPPRRALLRGRLVPRGRALHGRELRRLRRRRSGLLQRRDLQRGAAVRRGSLRFAAPLRRRRPALLQRPLRARAHLHRRRLRAPRGLRRQRPDLLSRERLQRAPGVPVGRVPHARADLRGAGAVLLRGQHLQRQPRVRRRSLRRVRRAG